MKKFTSLLLSLIIILTFVATLSATAVAAESGSCGDRVSWSLDGSTLTISGSGKMKNYTEYNSTPWKSHAGEIKTLVIEDGVTSVGDYAFVWLTSLTSLTLPKSLAEIGTNAFGWCSALKSVTIPDSVVSIGEYAFVWCSSLESISLPTSLEKLNVNAFYWCNGASELHISEDNTAFSVSDGVLFDKSGETLLFYPCGKTNGTYNIPSGVKSVGNGAFFYSTLKYVTVPESVKTIGKEAFYNAASLEKITFSDAPAEIGEAAFYGCTSLGEVILPNGVAKIGDSAFKNCKNIYCIQVPESVTEIGEAAFSGNPSLKISGEANSYIQSYASASGVLFQYFAKVMLDGKEIEFDQPPVVQSGRTLVPLRLVCKALGADVLWDGATRTATVTKGTVTLKVTIDSNVIIKNGVSEVLDVPAQIFGSRTLVPLRVISESFDVNVDWNAAQHTVILTEK